MDSNIDIAVIGSGSAGPVAASLLARQGHQVTVFEKAPSRLPIGAGFMLQPSGMEVIRQLGCYDQVIQQTQRIESLFCKTARGKVLLDLSYKDVSEELFGCGTQRAVFLDILLHQCELDGVKMLWGHEVTSIDQRGKKRVVASGDEDFGAFDLVLICDGARSVLRSQLSIKQSVKTYPWGALWFIGKRTESFDPTQLWQVVENTDVLNGFLPTGTSNDLLSLFYSVELSEIDLIRSTPLQQWKDAILRTAPRAESFLDQIHSFDQLKVAQYNDVVMPRWHEANVAILGDAAHALSPQLGQGVNLALQEAQSLATSIAAHRTLEDALPAYTKARKRQVKFYQFATRLMTPFFQSNYLPLGVIRDVGFPIAAKSTWIRDQMTLSMAGYKNGIFTAKPF